jgi:hypothetical protein
MLYGTNAIAEFHVCRVPEADVAIVLAYCNLRRYATDYSSEYVFGVLKIKFTVYSLMYFLLEGFIL